MKKLSAPLLTFSEDKQTLCKTFYDLHCYEFRLWLHHKVDLLKNLYPPWLEIKCILFSSFPASFYFSLFSGGFEHHFSRQNMNHRIAKQLSKNCQNSHKILVNLFISILEDLPLPKSGLPSARGQKIRICIVVITL